MSFIPNTSGATVGDQVIYVDQTQVASTTVPASLLFNNTFDFSDVANEKAVMIQFIITAANTVNTKGFKLYINNQLVCIYSGTVQNRDIVITYIYLNDATAADQGTYTCEILGNGNDPECRSEGNLDSTIFLAKETEVQLEATTTVAAGDLTLRNVTVTKLR